MLYIVALFAATAAAECYDASTPDFPVPAWENGAKLLAPTFEDLSHKLKDIASDPKYDNTSYSIEVTSSISALWTTHHTAEHHNSSRPGDTNIDGQSQYRIASITKLFTTLAILYQHEAGTLHLDDPITAYIPDLAPPNNGAIPWPDITLRSLASQLSGIPRDIAQAELANWLPDPVGQGLPPLPETQPLQPPCGENADYLPCNRDDLVSWLINYGKPVSAPSQRSSYSNVGFMLLGLALERVTGQNYSAYIHDAILAPLDMTSTTLEKPADTHAVLPLGESWYWGVEEGVARPTGGIYASSQDMSKFLRYLLTHYNGIAKGVNWLQPASWATGVRTFYGMPWEIYRSEKILPESGRAVTAATKGGGVPGYASAVVMLPEFGLGITVLVGGNVELEDELEALVLRELVPAAEKEVWKELERTHAGFWRAEDPGLNSSLELNASVRGGLVVNSFVSNGSDVLQGLLQGFGMMSGPVERNFRFQLVPTLLFKDEGEQRGEIWRMQSVLVRDEASPPDGQGDFCPTNVGMLSYGGLPVNEIVIWHEEGVIELPAWRLRMKAESGAKLVMQGAMQGLMKRLNLY